MRNMFHFKKQLIQQNGLLIFLCFFLGIFKNFVQAKELKVIVSAELEKCDHEYICLMAATQTSINGYVTEIIEKKSKALFSASQRQPSLADIADELIENFSKIHTFTFRNFKATHNYTESYFNYFKKKYVVCLMPLLVLKPDDEKTALETYLKSNMYILYPQQKTSISGESIYCLRGEDNSPNFKDFKTIQIN